MKHNNKVMKQTQAMLRQQYGSGKTELIMERAWEHYEMLCRKNASDSKAVRTHTDGKIYPCISIYTAMQQAGIEKAEALAFLDRSLSEQAQPQAASIRAMMKLPGMYHLMPRIFAWMTVHQFGENCGFHANFYPTDHTRVKFDMTHCLYLDVCRREGCPELTACFCHTDDVTDGNMHPKLIWNRTKTMGEGGDVCDFDLYIEK